MANAMGGYYTVMVVHAGRADEKKIPYVVFASSDYHAARIVKSETGYLARQQEVEGPH